MGKYNPIFYLYYRMVRLYESTFFASRSLTLCLCVTMWALFKLVTGYIDEIGIFGSVIISILLDMYAGSNFRKIVRLYYGESEKCRVIGKSITILYIIVSVPLSFWVIG